MAKLKLHVDTAQWLLTHDQASTRKRQPYQGWCRYHSCFEPCRSSDKMAIYLYPLYYGQTYSDEFLQLYHTVLHSEFYEQDPSEACLFLPNVDLLVPSREKVDFLYQLKFFKQADGAYGQNHLIFTEYSGF